MCGRTTPEYKEKLCGIKEENEQRLQLLSDVCNQPSFLQLIADVSEKNIHPLQQKPEKHLHDKEEEKPVHIKKEEEKEEDITGTSLTVVSLKSEDEDYGESQEDKAVEAPSSSLSQHMRKKVYKVEDFIERLQDGDVSELDSLCSENEEADEIRDSTRDDDDDDEDEVPTPENLDVLTDNEETENFVAEDNIGTGADSGGQEEIRVTKKDAIRWCHRPFTSVFDTSFENHPTHEKQPMSPFGYFKKYIPNEIFDLMADNTNIYAIQSGSLLFKPTSSSEIRTLMGLHLAMGVMKMPRVSMYWEAAMDIGIFKNAMARDRFSQLRSNLHLVNNLEKPPENNDVFFKVRPLYDAIRNRCLQIPLEENLCVDEQMVPFRGAFSIKQYIKGKPHPWGVKIYFLCGKSGIAYDFLLHQGLTMELQCQHRKQLGLGGAVVHHLSQRIPNANHKLYFGNYFTTYNILEILAERNIHAAGTARLSRFVRPPLLSDKEMSKRPRGSYDEVTSHDGKVAMVKWYDNRPVVMASNFVGVGRMDAVRRWEKRLSSFVTVPRPEVVKLYNEAMGGVDLLDQLVDLYRTDIRSKKWTLRMITHGFDIAVVNSWLEYRLETKKSKAKYMDLLHFKLDVAQCLMRVNQTMTKKRERPSASQPTNDNKRPALGRVYEVRPPSDVQHDLVDHLPNFDGKKGQTRCKMQNCKGKTHVFCDKCNIHLCFLPRRNCFLAAHR